MAGDVSAVFILTATPHTPTVGGVLLTFTIPSPEDLAQHHPMIFCAADQRLTVNLTRQG